MKSLLIVAGEASGDMHAAEVLRALRWRCPGINCWGIGGEKLQSMGMELLHDISEMDVLGFVEVVKRYSFFKKVFDEVLREVDDRKPDAALLIDYPGFNLRLAKELKKRGVKVLYYICPQVWAWKKDRIPQMADWIDRLMVIFPFEVEVFKDVDLQVDFVGHPLVDDLSRFRKKEWKPLPWSEGKKIALLPGSREQEIRRILPGLLRAALGIEQGGRLDISFIIAIPSNREELVKEVLRDIKSAPLHYTVVVDDSREVLKQADAALVASGTATLEAALLHCPTVLVYKTNPITYAIARYFIQIPWLGIVNIISGREVMPERIQFHMQPLELAANLELLMNDTRQRSAMIESFKIVEQKLGHGDPANRVTQIICDEIGISDTHDEDDEAEETAE
ncbi:MAG: lipid-A-disaccharide synthase [Kiritimatiellales bacterium]|nr:lipid-A-disaccharide synthase [Kiritimatiellales bacterium]